MAAKFREAVVRAFRAGLGDAGGFAEEVVAASTGLRKGALADAICGALAVVRVEDPDIDERADVQIFLKNIIDARRRQLTSARVVSHRQKAKRAVAGESPSPPEQNLVHSATTPSIDPPGTQDSAANAAESSQGRAPSEANLAESSQERAPHRAQPCLSEWCFERRVATIVLNGTEHTHEMLFPPSPAKGPGSSVTALFRVAGEPVQTQVRAIWWEVVTGAPSAKHRQVIRQLKAPLESGSRVVSGRGSALSH